MPPLLALWALLAALPWLLPTRTAPFATFYAEASLAGLLLALGAWACWRRPDRGAVFASVPPQPGVALDAPGIFLLALAVLPSLQAGAGLFVFPTEATLPSVYLAAAALSWVIARALLEQHGLQATDALWASLVVAALLSTGVALCQWLLITDWETWAPPSTVPSRAIANVGQPNNLATLLCWGLLGLWWGHVRGHIGAAVVMAAATFLLMGTVLTQSRSAWVTLAVLVGVGIAGRRALGGHRTIVALVALALVFVLMWWAHSHLSLALGLEPPRPAEDQASAGTRPLTWRLALDAIASRPWWGYGWNQFMVARVEFAPEYPQHHELVSYTHNVVLDLLVWNGFPLGALIVMAGSVWLWRRLRGAHNEQNAQAWLLIAALLVLGAHAMLELPHAYLFFLLPAMFMAGTLSGMPSSPNVVRVSLFAVAIALAGAATVGSLLVAEYRAIEAHEGSMRLHRAQVGLNDAPEPPRLHLLRWVTQSQAVLEQRPRAGLTGAELALWRRTLMRLPALSSLLRFAQASALSGDPTSARWALDLACHLYSRPECESTAAEWRQFAQRHAGAAEVPAPRWRQSN